MIPLLEFSSVNFGFAGRPIFQQACLRVEAGQCIALIGQNGAGKTTLLRLAAGLLRPTSGSVLFQGRCLSTVRRKEIARSIALVPQLMDVPFAFTVEQIVEQGRTPFLKPFGDLKPADRDAIETAFDMTDIHGLRHRIFNELSGGERQRVKIALGLAQEPELLLLDEPAQQLDIGRQFEMVELIRTLNMGGKTILASMHDLALAAGTFSTVMSLRPGEPVRQGRPQEILRPESLEQIFDCRPGSLRRREDCLA